jgi:hypothetical protein
MPLKFDPVRGKPALFYLVHRGTLTTAPATVTVTVAAAGAAAGVNSIPVDALPAAVPKNTVLTFSRAAGSPSTVRVVTTADAAEGATSIAVEDFEGADGDGIPFALADNDAATWDGLYTDIASESLDFQVNAQTQELNPVTHGSATGVSVSLPEITSIAPSVTRQGLFFSNSQIVKDILTYGDTNANFYGKLVQPDYTGQPWVTRAGIGVISGVGTPSPADNLIQLSYTFRFKTAVTPSFAS